MLERADWARLDRLLDEALERPLAERARFLDEACGADRELRARVEELLSFAEDPAGELREGGALAGPAFEDLAREMEGDGLGSLDAGSALGRFVVRGLLGRGGMGSVYRALDPALGREVAIKAVAQDFREDAASLRRFEREARLLATLNHPNVGAIYGFELIDGAPYLVLELVEGETLGDRLRHGALPVAEALPIAVQVADALQEAHHKGIVHRDLKPANVKLTETGRVKVLDFGIAKTVALPDDAEPPSRPELTTLPGTLLGTAPYMSPEQARGLPVDARSDIWAFGCLLYEMLTGGRAFGGRTASDSLASVLRDEVDWAALPPDTPAGVRRVLKRCLRKDPRERLQDAGDARLELTEAAQEDPAPPPPRPNRFRQALVALGALGLAALALSPALRTLLGRATAPAPAATRLSLDLPAGLALADTFAAPFAFSPDGAGLALVLKRGADSASAIYERGLDDLEVRPLPDTAGGWQPAFAPDGAAIAFFADRKLKRVPRGGGAVQALADVGGNPRGASWGEDDTIVFAPSQTSGLVRVSADGGTPKPLTRPDEAAGEISHRWPQVLPGGKHVLFTVALEDGTYDEARIEVLTLATGERRRLLERGAHARYLKGGHLVFARGGRLFAVPFDLDRLETRGTPEVVVEGVRYDPQNGGTHFAVSGAGALAYTPGVPTPSEHPLSVVDAAGHFTRIGPTPRLFREPTFSPDGRRAAVVMGNAAESDLWVADVASGTLSRLTFGLRPRRPTWTPDGTGITVGAPAAGGWKLITIRRDGSGSPLPLLETPHRAYPNAWSQDGRVLVYQERSAETGWDLQALDLGPGGQVEGTRALVATPFEESNASLSRDGRFLAYESDELDSVFEIYVRPLRGSGPKVRISSTGARWARFGAAGRLYYWLSSRGGVQRVVYHVEGDRFVPDAVAPLWSRNEEADPAFPRRVLVTGSYGGFDADPTGERFLVLERTESPAEAPLRRPVVVLNWADELAARGRRGP